MSILKETAERNSTAAGPVVTVDTDAIPAPDRFGWWGDMVGQEVMSVTIRSTHAPRFRGLAQSVRLPHTEVGTFTYSPMKAWRSPAQVRRDNREEYFLVLVGSGTAIRLEQERGVACLDAGGIALFSSSYPLTCEFTDRGGPCRTTQVRLPRTVLPLANGRADRLLAEPLSTRSGSGALLVPYLTGLTEAVRHCGPAELARLGAVGVDLAASLLAAHLGDTDRLPAETRQAALLARVNAFIDHHLADPELRPQAIAAHHHISVRTLHQLFRSEPESVGATIRRRRLERCRADLTAPGPPRPSIGAIALRWGFRHPADFSRAFRNAYGVPPSEVRADAVSALDAKKDRTLG